MAQITTENTRIKRAGFSRRKKHSLRIDMTPMVDLGFLLITFFVFTSTMNEPKAMGLILPKEGPQMPTRESGALTILPAGGNKVYYYEGFYDESKIKNTSLKGIRQVIIDKKNRTNADDLFIIIKPTKSATYKNVVDILDEMTISDIKRYALVKITNEKLE
jgi:biopolymer transport protein ExbD